MTISDDSKRNVWGGLARSDDTPTPISEVTQETYSHMRGRASGDMMGLNFPTGMICRVRKGKTVFRRANGSGADSKKMPLEHYLEARLSEYKAAGNKVARNLNLLMMNRASKGMPKPKAEAHKLAVQLLAEQNASKGRSLNAFIAGKLKISVRRVQQIRNKIKSEITENA